MSEALGSISSKGSRQGRRARGEGRGLSGGGAEKAEEKEKEELINHFGSARTG